MRLPALGEHIQDATKEVQIVIRVGAEIVRMPPEVEYAPLFGRRANSAGDPAEPNGLKALPLRRVRPEEHARTDIAKTARLKYFLPAHYFGSGKRNIVVQQTRRSHREGFLATRARLVYPMGLITAIANDASFFQQTLVAWPKLIAGEHDGAYIDSTAACDCDGTG